MMSKRKGAFKLVSMRNQVGWHLQHIIFCFIVLFFMLFIQVVVWFVQDVEAVVEYYF